MTLHGNFLAVITAFVPVTVVTLVTVLTLTGMFAVVTAIASRC